MSNYWFNYIDLFEIIDNGVINKKIQGMKAQRFYFFFKCLFYLKLSCFVNILFYHIIVYFQMLVNLVLNRIFYLVYLRKKIHDDINTMHQKSWVWPNSTKWSLETSDIKEHIKTNPRMITWD